MYIWNDKYFTYYVFKCIKPSANSMLRHCTFTIRYNMNNYLSGIFMNFNKNRRNGWKIAEKSRGCTSKITHISVVKCPIVPNLILSQCIDTTCLPKWSNLLHIKFRFSWILMKTWEIREKYRKIKGVYLQSDAYLSFQAPNSSKPGTISNSIILSVFE